MATGWCPPNDFKKSELKLDVENILISPDYGKAIISDRIFAENSEYEKPELIRKLTSLLHMPGIIIIPSLKGDIIGRADNTVRFLDDKTVLCNEALAQNGCEPQLQTILQYHGLDVSEFPFAPKEETGTMGCYLNFLETDEAVFLPIFGIETDEKAVATAEKLFSKPVEPVMIPNIAAE